MGLSGRNAATKLKYFALKTSFDGGESEQSSRDMCRWGYQHWLFEMPAICRVVID